MGVEDRILWEGDVPRGMVAVIGADDDVFDRLVGDLADLIDQTPGFLRIPLAIGNENALGSNHKETDGGDNLLVTTKLLVGVDVVG